MAVVSQEVSKSTQGPSGSTPPNAGSAFDRRTRDCSVSKLALVTLAASGWKNFLKPSYFHSETCHAVHLLPTCFKGRELLLTGCKMVDQGITWSGFSREVIG